MPRTPYAARVFTDQVKAMRKSAKFEFGDEDGFGVQRSVTFDKATSKWLEPILDQFDDDRIVGYGVGDKGLLTVVFSHRHIADSRDEFLLAEAQVVADDQQN